MSEYKMSRAEKETLMRVKKYLESTMTISVFLCDNIRVEHRALYVEVYNRLHPGHTISANKLAM